MALDKDVLKADLQARLEADLLAFGSPTLSQTCASIAGAIIDHLVGNNIELKPGMIMQWSGTIATIPAGWHLCDGTEGTPDLRDKFIVGAKQDDAGVAKTNVSGSLTQSGGNISHAHDSHVVTQPADHAAISHTGAAVADHTGLMHTISGAGESVSGGTPAGTVSQPTFTGDALASHAHGVGTYDAAAASAGTPAGTIGAISATASSAQRIGTGTSDAAAQIHTHAAPTFTGDALATHDHTLSGSSESVAAGTPAGTVSQPNFTGIALAGHAHGPGTLAVGDHGAGGTIVHGVTQPADHAAQSHAGAAVDAHSSEEHLNPYYALAFIMKMAA